MVEQKSCDLIMKITIKKLIKYYKKEEILNLEHFEVSEISSLAIIGPSGSGKSTLLKILGRIEYEDSGEIEVDQFKLNKDKKDNESDYLSRIGFVFQSNNLFPNLSVIDNIAICLQYSRHIHKLEAGDRAKQCLEKVGITEEHHLKKIGQISGGQQQRVAIARALSLDAKFLLLDEPTSSLDPELAFDVMKTLIATKQITDSIIVTHELNFARNFADYYLFLDKGKILEHGKIGQLFDSHKKRVREFVSKIDFK